MVFEGEDILDSSDVTFDIWVELAKQVEIGYDVFDGFVITHGTNTMAYTASVLSFMLENLAKPVVLTGSQVPCFEPISDGPHNLAGAIFMAGASNINGVNLFFDGKLFRGNRARKNSAIDWNGFESPNLEPLCTLQNFPAGSNDTQKKIINPSLVVETRLCRNVSVIFFTPVLSLDSLSKSLSLPTEGAVLACYGANSLPMGRRDLMEELASASKRGVLLVAISQCHRTCSTKMSSANPDLRSNGIIPGADMTVEAAVAKLSYVLGKANLDLEGKKKMMEVNLAGELTPIDPTR